MKALLKSSAVMIAALFFQAAQAQVGVNLKSTTSATTNATVNAAKATQAAVNATNKVTVASANAVKATTGAVKQTSSATIQSGNKIKDNTKVNGSADADVTNHSKADMNSNKGGEEKGLIRASSVSEAEVHSNANATLPVSEAKEDMKKTGEQSKETADKTKDAAEKKETKAKEKIKSTKPSVKAEGQVKAQGAVKAGKQ